MPNKLKITTSFDKDKYVLRAEVVEAEHYLPKHIFIWSKGDDGRPSVFVSTAYADELSKISQYNPEDIPRKFGVRLLRLNYAQVEFPSKESMANGVTVMKNSFAKLVGQLREGSTPEEEVFEVI